MNRQLTSLSFMHEGHEINLDQSDSAQSIQLMPPVIPQSSLEPYLWLTSRECADMVKRILSNIQPALPVQNVIANGLPPIPIGKIDVKAGDQNDGLLVGEPVEINLSPAQIKVVLALKESIAGGQLLGFLQGFRGARKTTTGQKMDEVTGLRVLHCGSTGTAAANFKSETINSLLSLGLSVDNIDLATEITRAQTMAKIVQLMDYYHMLY